MFSKNEPLYGEVLGRRLELSYERWGSSHRSKEMETSQVGRVSGIKVSSELDFVKVCLYSKERVIVSLNDWSNVYVVFPVRTQKKDWTVD